MLVEVRGDRGAGDPQWYQLLLGATAEDPAELPPACRLGRHAHPPGRGVALRRPGRRGTGAGLRATWCDPDGTFATVRALPGDHLNTSLVLDESYLLKVFRQVHDGPNPDVEVTEALGRVGYGGASRCRCRCGGGAAPTSRCSGAWSATRGTGRDLARGLAARAVQPPPAAEGLQARLRSTRPRSSVPRSPTSTWPSPRPSAREPADGAELARRHGRAAAPGRRRSPRHGSASRPSTGGSPGPSDLGSSHPGPRRPAPGASALRLRRSWMLARLRGRAGPAARGATPAVLAAARRGGDDPLVPPRRRRRPRARQRCPTRSCGSWPMPGPSAT